MAEIRLEDLHKVHPGGTVALRGVTLTVADGELVVMVGPSGCGKTSVLRIVAGLDRPTRGRVWIGGRDATDLGPRERDVAMVFQSYALYPHLSVRDNLGFGLRMRGVPRAEIRRRVEAVAATLGLRELLERRPAQLSGGQRQRVALGRAIVREPQAFLLDEPLSNLDAKLRVETRAELARLHRRLGATMLYVTHDQEEAMTLGDRVAVLRAGELQQVGAPLEIYRRPANLFVAGFIGSPPMNLLPVRLEPVPGSEGLRLLGSGFELELPAPWPTRAPAACPPRELVLGIRPEAVELVPPGRGEARGRVEVVETLGASALVHASLAGAPGAPGRAPATLRVRVAAEHRPRLDEEVGLCFPGEALHLFDAAGGKRLSV